MYELYSFFHRGNATQQSSRLPNVSLDGIARLAIAFAIIAAAVTLLDHAAANQVQSVVAANAAGAIQRGN